MKPTALVTLLLGTATLAQQPTFRSTASLVRIEVSVTDDHGPVEGLLADDFVLTDSGAIHRAAVYESKDAPLDLVAIVQPLQSLGQTSEQQAPSAAAGFAAFIDNIDARDRLGVLVATAPPVRLRPLSFGKPQLDPRAIEGSPYAATFDAITAGLGEFLPSDRRRVLVAFTNGADFRSTVSFEGLVQQTRRLGPAFVLVGSATHVRQEALVGAVLGGEGGRELASATAVVSGFVFPSSLQVLARRTGGITVDLGKGDPAEVIKRAFAWMRTRYVLSYEPPALKGWHSLAIRVNRKGATVTARDGYFVN